MPYPAGDSNPQPPLSGSGASTTLGYPGMFYVDRLGIEPSTSGLQSETVHQHPAHGANGRDRTDYLRRTKAAHCPQCLAGQRAGGGARTRCLRFTKPTQVPTCSTGMVPSAGVEPATTRFSTWRLYQIGLQGQAPSPGVEPSLRRSERRVLPIDDEGKAAAGVRTRDLHLGKVTRYQAALQPHAGHHRGTSAGMRFAVGSCEPSWGVEPQASRVPGGRSDQTELRRHTCVLREGVEPPPVPGLGRLPLPLGYRSAEGAGLEPAHPDPKSGGLPLTEPSWAGP